MRPRPGATLAYFPNARCVSGPGPLRAGTLAVRIVKPTVSVETDIPHTDHGLCPAARNRVRGAPVRPTR